MKSLTAPLQDKLEYMKNHVVAEFLGFHNISETLEYDMLARNSWYFRNALVRADYSNIQKGIASSIGKSERTVKTLTVTLQEKGRNNFIERHFGADPFAGAARRFRNYFVGVSDDGLRRLVKEHIPLPRRIRWLGDRREAAIFGQTPGIKCSLMNKSFFFPGKNGMPRDLNYSSYDIAPILESMKFSEG